MMRGQKIKMIFTEVCSKHGITKCEVISPCRIRAPVYCRMEVAYRLRVETSLSLNQIAGILQRDHTTVLYYIQKVTARLKDGPWPVAAYSKRTQKLPKVPAQKPVYPRPVPKAMHRQISTINGYWNAQGVQANARAEHIAHRVVIKSDLQMVT